MAQEFRLPELGENITSGTVVSVAVAQGDAVHVDQTVMEVETEKAVVEIPATLGGTVTEVRVEVGQTINVGDVVFLFDETAAPAEPERPAPKAKPAAKRTPPKKAPSKPAAQRKPVGSAGTIVAAPSVRRLARELGVDLPDVAASGDGGRVLTEDVRAHADAKAEEPAAQPAQPLAEGAPPAAEGSDDEDRWGPIERVPMTAIRKKTAERMAHAWETIPHVTHFDQADITEIEAFRKQHGGEAEAAGGKLTVSIVVLKAVAAALREFPELNATVDMEEEAILLKKYIHVGMAVDTPNGLLVPVVRDVDRKGLVALSVEVADLSERARTRKLTLEEMQGGTFTITNLGGIGGTGFTPIINAPEAAILGVSRSRVEPVLANGQFVPRTMLPLALSYDHRIIDGADAARFLRWLAEALERPWVLFLEDHGDS